MPLAFQQHAEAGIEQVMALAEHRFQRGAACGAGFLHRVGVRVIAAADGVVVAEPKHGQSALAARLAAE